MTQPTVNERLSKHDREIAAIRKLIVAGMKMLASTNRALASLTASQRETGRQLQAFIRSLRGGSNGYAKRKVELQ